MEGGGGVFLFVVMKKGKREIEQGACWKDSKVRLGRVCRLRDMF